MKNMIRNAAEGLLVLAVVAFLITGCTKEKPNVQPIHHVSDFTYDPSSLPSVLESVNAKYGTAYSGPSGTANGKETIIIVKGIVDKYNPGLGCYPYNWICEVIVIGSNNGKELEGIIGKKADIIACTAPDPELYKNVTILDHYETPYGTRTIFE